MERHINSDVGEGYAIVVAGYIGLKGTKIIAEAGKSALLSRYNEDFILSAQKLYDIAETLRVQELPEPIVEVGEGGIFKALWDVSVEYRMGFDVNIFDIPVRQETIELANFFDINPYEMLSEKCYVILARSGFSLVKRLNDTGVKAAVIGEVTAGHDKIVRHQDGALFLRPAKQDAIQEFYKRTGDIK